MGPYTIDVQSPVDFERTKRRVLIGLQRSAVLSGRITGRKVEVWRHDTSGRHSGGAVFRGVLATDGGAVRLRGRLAFSWLGRITNAVLIIALLYYLSREPVTVPLGLVAAIAIDIVFPILWYRSERLEIANTLKMIVEEPDTGEP